MAYEAITDSAGEGVAGSFWAATQGKKKSWKRANALLRKFGGKLAGLEIKNFDGGEAHDRQRSRNARGRVLKGSRPSFIVKNENVGAKGTTNLDRYIAKKQAMVGFTHSAWYNCMRLLGARNRRSKSKGLTREDTEITKPFPKWVQRHKPKGYGMVFFNEGADSHSVTIHNNVRWSRQAVGEGMERYIIGKARQDLIKSLILDIIEKKDDLNQKRA